MRTSSKKPFSRILLIFTALLLLVFCVSCDVAKAVTAPDPAETPDSPALTGSPALPPAVSLPEIPSPVPPVMAEEPFANKSVIYNIRFDDDLPDYPLMAMIERENIYLYGTNEKLNEDGMYLFVNEKKTYFDWPMSSVYNAPQLMTGDFDNNGGKDLAVIFSLGGGTFLSLYDLYIVKDIESGVELADFALYSDRAWELMNGVPLAAALADDHITFMFEVLGERYQVECFNEPRIGLFTGVRFDNCNVNFEFEDGRIKTSVAVSMEYENIATPQNFGRVEAYVLFDGENFALEDHSFALDWNTNGTRLY